MKKKLYHYTRGTSYNVFKVSGGGSVIVREDEHGVSTMCCSSEDAKDKVDLLLQEQYGTVCFHEHPVEVSVA